MEVVLSNLPTISALIVTGIFAGLLAGLLGVGGGIVIVPVLFFLFQRFGVSPQSAMLIATATSLATIVPTSLSAIRSHHKLGNVDLTLLRSWCLYILLGVIMGSLLVTQYGHTPIDAPLGTYGLVNLLGFVCIVPLTVFFAPIGAKLANIIDANMLKRVFAVLLFVTGLRMFAQLFV